MSRGLSSSGFRDLPYFLFVLLLAYAMQTALGENNTNPGEQLTGRIDYRFVRHLGQKDDAGRLLTWEAAIEGDINGKMKWWFEDPAPVSPITHTGGRTTFYVARWEVWVDDKLVLAGESAGKTDFSNGADGMWDGHGRVTEASGDYEAFKGRQIYETGPVILGQDPPRTFSGTGMFTVF